MFGGAWGATNPSIRGEKGGNHGVFPGGKLDWRLENLLMRCVSWLARALQAASAGNIRAVGKKSEGSESRDESCSEDEARRVTWPSLRPGTRRFAVEMQMRVANGEYFGGVGQFRRSD